MRAIVFINGVIDEYDWLRTLIQADDYLVCADGGTRHCLAIGKIPHIVVGDLDSVDEETVANLAEQGVAIEEHPRAKNETDLELAVDRAVSLLSEDISPDATTNEVNELLLVGALGGRIDQMLANLFILAQRNWPVAMRIVDQGQEAQLVRGGQTLTMVGNIGDTVSALPLSESVTGITYTGLVYPLDNATLALGSTRGISNEMAYTKATVSVGTGVLLVTKISNLPGGFGP